jgi:hypothetical protein
MNYLPLKALSLDMMRPAGKGSEDRTIDNDRLLEDSEAVYPWSRQSNKAARYSGSSLGWTIVLLIVATALSCMIGILIGYQRDDLDDVCSRHTSHYCMSPFPALHPLSLMQAVSTGHRERSYQVPPPAIQRLLLERERLPPGCWTRGRCGLGGVGCELYVGSWLLRPDPE